jgi:hypothetical protein
MVIDNNWVLCPDGHRVVKVEDKFIMFPSETFNLKADSDGIIVAVSCPVCGMWTDVQQHTHSRVSSGDRGY